MSNTMHWHPRWGLRMALEEQGLKQKDLAHRLGWAESRVSKLLDGKQAMTVEDLIVMARELDRDIGDLFDPPPRPNLASPPNLDLGQAASPRYVKLAEGVARPRDNRPPTHKAA
jgi:transcriptional regulator with XRE-family HTH domain